MSTDYHIIILKGQYIYIMSQQLDKKRHCVFRLTFHAVLVVKYRRKCITQEIGQYLIDRSRVVIEANGGELIEGNSDIDHIHLLFSLQPDVNLSHFMASLKNTTSRMVRKTYGEYLSNYLYKDSFWSDSFYLSTTGGASIDVVQKYIENQGKPKRKYVKRAKSSL